MSTIFSHVTLCGAEKQAMTIALERCLHMLWLHEHVQHCSVIHFIKCRFWQHHFTCALVNCWDTVLHGNHQCKSLKRRWHLWMSHLQLGFTFSQLNVLSAFECAFLLLLCCNTNLYTCFGTSLKSYGRETWEHQPKSIFIESNVMFKACRSQHCFYWWTVLSKNKTLRESNYKRKHSVSKIA